MGGLTAKRGFGMSINVEILGVNRDLVFTRYAP